MYRIKLENEGTETMQLQVKISSGKKIGATLNLIRPPKNRGDIKLDTASYEFDQAFCQDFFIMPFNRKFEYAS